MRIVTRGDFDGMACCVLLTEVEQVREIRFAHPKDAQDAKVVVDEEDIVVNIPYIEGCGIWFDHHVSELLDDDDAKFTKGRFEVAPSCARVIYHHYCGKHADQLDQYMDMIDAADRLDSATLNIEDVTTPTGWILLGLTLDPRSGLGPEFRKYFRWLVEYVKGTPVQTVMEHPAVKTRADRVLVEQEMFKSLLRQHARCEGNVIITDFRGLRDKPVGNRFLVYTLFPDANVEVRFMDGFGGKQVAAVGHNIFNRTCDINIGEMLTAYGGGGHRGAGTAQFDTDEADQKFSEIIARLQQAPA